MLVNSSKHLYSVKPACITLVLMAIIGAFTASSSSESRDSGLFNVTFETLGSNEDCLEKILKNDGVRCGVKSLADLQTIIQCETLYTAGVCLANAACDQCEHDDAITTENNIRTFMKLPMKVCSLTFTPPKPLDQPFCRPTFFTTTVIIIIAVIVGIILLVIIALLVYCCCCSHRSHHSSKRGGGGSGSSHRKSGASKRGRSSRRR